MLFLTVLTNPWCDVLYSLLSLSSCSLVWLWFYLHVIARLNVDLLLVITMILIISCHWYLFHTSKFIGVILNLKFKTNYFFNHLLSIYIVSTKFDDDSSFSSELGLSLWWPEFKPLPYIYYALFLSIN